MQDECAIITAIFIDRAVKSFRQCSQFSLMEIISEVVSYFPEYFQEILVFFPEATEFTGENNIWMK